MIIVKEGVLMQLDVRTLYLGGSVVAFIFAIALIEVWYINKYRYKGIFEWILSLFILAVGVNLTIYRTDSNEFLTIFISNMLIFSSYVLLIRGFCRFMIIPNRKAQHGIIVFIMILIFLYFLYVYPSLQMRFVIISLVSIYFFGYLSYMILYKMPAYYVKTTRFLMAVSLSFIAVNIVRLIYLVSFGIVFKDLFDNQLNGTVSGIAIIVYMTLLPISLLVLIHNRAQTEILVEEVKFESAFYESPTVMIISKYDNGLILDVNKSFELITGFTKEEAVGRTSVELGIWESESYRAETYRKLFSREKVAPLEVKLNTKSGKVIDVIFSSSEMALLGEKTIISLASDVTEFYKAKEELTYIATHDSLTGLLNRHQLNNHFNELVMEFLKTKKGFTLVFMDLDRFKPVNDTYGHDFGDLVLIEVARILKTVFNNHFVARLGGDEFIVLLRSDSTEKDVIEKINRTRKAIEGFKELDGNTINMGASLGYSKYPQEGKLLEELIHEADKKMYEEKTKKHHK